MFVYYLLLKLTQFFILLVHQKKNGSDIKERRDLCLTQTGRNGAFYFKILQSFMKSWLLHYFLTALSNRGLSE